MSHGGHIDSDMQKERGDNGHESGSAQLRRRKSLDPEEEMNDRD